MLYKHPSHRFAVWFVTLALVALSGLILPAILAPNQSLPRIDSPPTASSSDAPAQLETPAALSRVNPDGSSTPPMQSNPDDSLAKVANNYGRLPLSFEMNRGQTDRQVKFLARGQGYGLFLTSSGPVLSLEKVTHTTATEGELGSSREPGGPTNRAVLSLHLQGANSAPKITGEDMLPGKVNYFVGKDPRKWRTGVRTFSKVRYRNVYRGVDLVYYGNQRQLEYDFVVAPHADPNRIKLNFTGADNITTAENGDLILSTTAGDVVQRKAFAYQDIDGKRIEVSAAYRMAGDTVSFVLGNYDKAQPLIIDPVLLYSTFIGGSFGEQGLGVAVDAQGNAFLVGNSISTNFPTTGGSVQPISGGIEDAFVLKLNSAGSALVYSTYLGGSETDSANGVALDGQGNAYVTGITFSDNFPVTPGAFQVVRSGDSEGFVTKLNASGSGLIYSTFLAGPDSDTPLSIAVSSDGRAYVVGRSSSTNFNSVPLDRHGSPAFKSTNSGASWASSASGLNAANVSAFAIDPANSNIVYAGTFTGVYKSTDAGANWQITGTANTATAPQIVNSVLVDPTNSSVIYAATNFGVYKSTDGGSLYTEKNNGIFFAVINALAIDPITPTTLYAGTVSGIYKSIDGGDNWVEQENGFFNPPHVTDLAIDPSNAAIIYMGTREGMYKTTNGGAVWFSINDGVIHSLTAIASVAIDPSNSAIVYAAPLFFSGVIYKTTNGGTDWVPLTSGLPPVTATSVAINPATPSTLYAATNGRGIYKSTDGGASWTSINTGLTNSVVTAIVVDRNNPAILYAGAAIGADAFAVRFNPAGSTLEQVLMFGGDENDEARGVALDETGAAYVVGSTSSLNFPVVNPFQAASGGSTDAFLAKFNASGSGFVYSTYLGGSDSDQGRAIAVRQNSAYVVGITGSTNYPLLNPFQPTIQPFNFDAFVTKFNAAGSALEFSSYLGGGLGGEQALGVALDSEGNTFITGLTNSNDFPTVNPTQTLRAGNNDAFVTKVSPSGASLLFSTYLGGSAADQGNGVAVDESGNAYIIGTTSSTNFPTVNPFQPLRGGSSDGFVTKLGAAADLLLTKGDSRDPVMVGNNLTYTLTITNLGVDTAHGINLTDTLPANVNFVSATASQGTCSGTLAITCNLGSLIKDASATVRIVVAPQSVGTITNSATVTATTLDPNSPNNSATQETRVSALPSIAGRVTNAAGVGTPSVLMTLTGSQTANTTTSAGGFYQFPDLASGGNYSVTPARQGFVFHPQSQSFTNLSADATADFQSVACIFSITPRNQSFNSSGGNGVVTITGPDSLCPWTAVSDVPWITVTSSPTGFGSGTVNFTVAPTTSSRSGTLRIGNNVFTVWQELSPCASVSFFEAPRFPAGPSPRFVAKGDFNNDGKADVVFVSDSSPAKVSVVLGNGTGGFGAPLSVNILGSGEAIAVGDLNNDGKLDVAVTLFGQSQNVQILLGDGAGNIISFGVFTAGSLPAGVTIGEFNNDGKPDLAVANTNSHNISILLGTGTGAFGSATQIGGQATHAAQRVVVGNFNGDNNQDLISQGSHMALMTGRGDGTFEAPILQIPTMGAVVVGDFNGDGKDDLAGTTINNGPFITMFPGNGLGGFDAVVHSSAGGRGSGRLVVADFDGDGDLDLESANNSFSGTSDVNIHLNNGSGSFTPGPAYVTGAGVRDIAAADFNGDGKQDLVAADSHSLIGSASGEFVFLAGTGSGSLIGARSFVAPGTILEVEALQFDDDGKLDLLVISSHSVSLLRGTAPGEFADPVLLAMAAPAIFDSGKLTYSTRDLNRDGKPDLTLLVNEFGVLVRTYLNNGNGGLTPASDTAIQSPFVLEDFNSDGYPDLVARNSSVLLTLRLGNGTGAFGPPTVVSNLTNASRFISGDFNGDGKADLIGSTISLPCGSNSLQILFGDGMGGFSSPALMVLPSSVETMLAQDLNGDGRSELIITNCANQVQVLFANDNGGFSVGPEFSGGPGVPRRLALADMNGDGKPDLIVSNDTNQVSPSTVSILLGDGAGAFSGLTTHLGSLYTIPIAIGDFDNNGRADLAAGFLSGNHVGIFLNLCPVVFPPGVKFTSGQYFVSEGAARVQIDVSRSGNTSASAAVDYKTSDTAGLTNCSVVNGIASARCDYATVVGRLSFAAGETSKTVSIPIVDDAYAEGSESFTITLSNPSGIDLGGPAVATVTINDNETVNGPNPIDQTPFLVRQQYVDFLGREPDPAGAAAWEAVINNCPAGDTTCDRIHVSSAFFRSAEFQGRGYFVYRFYPVALGRKPDYGEFVPDLAQVSGFLSDAELEAAKVAFVTGFMNKTEFFVQYNFLNDTQYVDTLLATAQVTSTNRGFWIAALGSGTRTRAQVLREIAESTEVNNRYYNQAFVVMQYFGYLRRDPDGLYLNWIAHLDSTGDYRSMINGFMNSLEYRFRFGP